MLKLVVEGRSSKDIAGRLALTPKTVDSHRHRIMAKLGIKNLVGLVKFAIRHGLTSL